MGWNWSWSAAGMGMGGTWWLSLTRAGDHLRSFAVTGGDLRRRARIKSSRYQQPMAMMQSALRQLSRNA